jgi:hypothetical protein
MPSIDELTRERRPHAASAKGSRPQITEGDYQRNNDRTGTVVGVDQLRNILSPDEVDEQIRRFFEQRPPQSVGSCQPHRHFRFYFVQAMPLASI